MGVGEDTATTLAMVIHELATNSVKHGALSSDAGTLDISSRSDEENIYVIWAETGGPEISRTPDMSGYGSRLIERSVAGRFRGSLDYDWQATGLVATLRMRKDRLAA